MITNDSKWIYKVLTTRPRYRYKYHWDSTRHVEYTGQAMDQLTFDPQILAYLKLAYLHKANQLVVGMDVAPSMIITMEDEYGTQQNHIEPKRRTSDA